MWKARPDEKPYSQPNPSLAGTSVSPVSTATPVVPSKDLRPPEPAKVTEPFRSDVAAHIGKYNGLFARLCVVWHCVENVGGKLTDVYLRGHRTARAGR